MPNNRTKGQSAEREIVKLLAKHGFRARRGNQTSFHSTEADIECDELHDMKTRIEVKIANEFKLGSPAQRKEWLEQMEKDLRKRIKPTDNPLDWDLVLFHRAKRQDWFVWRPRFNEFLLAEDYLGMIRLKISLELL